MGKDPVGGCEMGDGIQCDSGHCRSHEYMDRTVNDLKAIQAQLIVGQQQLQAAFSQLAENTRAVLRLHERLDKVETRQWIAIGGLTVISGLSSAGWVLKLIKIVLE